MTEVGRSREGSLPKTFGLLFFWGVKQCFLGKKCTITWYIWYYIESTLQICNYAQKRRICRENSNYVPDENCVAKFAFAESCQLLSPCSCLMSKTESDSELKSDSEMKSSDISLLDGDISTLSKLKTLHSL